MTAIGWILAGVGILLANGLIWVVLYQREVGVLNDRIARLEHRLANRGGSRPHPRFVAAPSSSSKTRVEPLVRADSRAASFVPTARLTGEQ